MFKILSIVITCLIACGNTFASEKKLITINQFISHPALDAVTHGIEESLQERKLLLDKVELQIANAQGNIANSVQVAKHQASLMPAVMIGIATPSAQSSLKARLNPTSTIIAFAAVTDPTLAGLSTEENIIGVTDTPPIEELVDITLQILPNIKTMGVIFNPGEVNSVKTVEILEKILASKHVLLRKAALNSSSGVKAAVQMLIGGVDVIYIPQDNIVVSTIDTITKEAGIAKIPVIANDPLLVDHGLLLSLGCDYLRSGKQLGFMIADKLEGKKISQNIMLPNTKELRVNQDVAKLLNVQIPKNIIQLREKL